MRKLFMAIYFFQCWWFLNRMVRGWGVVCWNKMCAWRWVGVWLHECVSTCMANCILKENEICSCAHLSDLSTVQYIKRIKCGMAVAEPWRKAAPDFGRPTAQSTCIMKRICNGHWPAFREACTSTINQHFVVFKRNQAFVVLDQMTMDHICKYHEGHFFAIPILSTILMRPLQDFLVTAKSLQGGLDIGIIMSSNSQDCYSCVNINWVCFAALSVFTAVTVLYRTTVSFCQLNCVAWKEKNLSRLQSRK